MVHAIMELRYGIGVSFVANTLVIQILSCASHSILQSKTVERAGKQQQ